MRATTQFTIGSTVLANVETGHKVPDSQSSADLELEVVQQECFLLKKKKKTQKNKENKKKNKKNCWRWRSVDGAIAHTGGRQEACWLALRSGIVDTLGLRVIENVGELALQGF